MTVEQVAIEVSVDRRHDAGSWRAASVCRKFPTRWWFGGDHRETVRAKEICASCVVRGPCLDFALGRPELLGVWAATTPTERVAMRRAGGAATKIEVGADVDVDVDVRTVVEAEVRLDLVVATERDLGREPIVSGPPARPAGGVIGVDELFTPAEAARKLGVTPNTVTRWSRAGKILSIQTMGGHRRFRRSEIDRILNKAIIVVDAAVPI